MALNSMTGFGRGEASAGGLKVEVELSSVNRKQFDARVSLPPGLAAWEPEIVGIIHKAVARGYVRGTVRTAVSEPVRRRRIVVDAALAKAHVGRLRRTAAALGLKDDLTASSLTALPDVLRYEERPEEALRIRPLLKRALQGALADMLRMRKREGQSIEKHLCRELDRAGQVLSRIRKRAPAAVRNLARALRQRLLRAGADVPSDDPVLKREMAVLADRADISEEIVRLDSHMDQARRMLAAEEPAGRSLDFLCQEMFREINTIGSKANDAKISEDVVAFKALLEVIREQVQNVE